MKNDLKTTAGLPPWLIYVRVSTEDQAREGVSLDAQRESCLAMAKALSLPVAETIEDPGRSAKDLDRPGVQRALGEVEAGRAAGLIVYKLDRLTRSRRDLEDLLDRFAKAGAGLISVSEKLDTSSPMGRFFVAMLGAIAQWERETIAERVQMGMNHRRAQGGFLGGPPPAGLRVIPADGGGKRLVVDETWGPVVQSVWPQIAGGASLAQVAATLNAAHLPGSKRWSPTTVRKIALNDRYVGLLVTAEEQAQVKAELSSRFNPFSKAGKMHPHGTHAERPWPLSGIGRCATCGATLAGVSTTNASGTTFAYYRCTNRAKHGRTACASKDLRAEPWEVAVVDALVRSVQQDGRLYPTLAEFAAKQREDAGPLQSQRLELVMERDRLGVELVNLGELAAQGGAVAAGLARTIGERHERWASLDRRVATIDGQLAAALMTADQADALAQVLRERIATLPILPPQLQADAVQLLVAQVTLRPIDKAKGEIHLSVNLPRGSERFYSPASKTATGLVPAWPMVEIWGFEPQTCSLRTNRSTN